MNSKREYRNPMKLNINGKLESLDGEHTIASLLHHRGQDGRVAVAVNEEFVPRAAYGEVALKEGDEVEIVAPMQGG